jgi:hypothetical protein
LCFLYRCVFEKSAQNVAQRISCLNYCITFTAVKSSSKIWGTSVIFKNLPKVPPPKRRKFAQSGHSFSVLKGREYNRFNMDNFYF